MSSPRHLPQVHGVGLTVTFSLRSTEAQSPYSASYCRSAVQHAQTRMYEFRSAVSSQHLFLLDPKASASRSQEEYSPHVRADTLNFPNAPNPLSTDLLTKSTMIAIKTMQDTSVAEDCGDIHATSQDAIYRGRIGMPFAAKTHVF